MVEQLTKILKSRSDIKMEMKYISKNRINAFSGYTGKMEVILNITTNKGIIYSITYKLTNNIYYEDFIRFLRKNENSSR